MDTAEKVQGQRAFLKIQIRNYCAMKSMGTKERGCREIDNLKQGAL